MKLFLIVLTLNSILVLDAKKSACNVTLHLKKKQNKLKPANLYVLCMSEVIFVECFECGKDYKRMKIMLLTNF